MSNMTKICNSILDLIVEVGDIEGEMGVSWRFSDGFSVSSCSCWTVKADGDENECCILLAPSEWLSDMSFRSPTINAAAKQNNKPLCLCRSTKKCHVSGCSVRFQTTAGEQIQRFWSNLHFKRSLKVMSITNDVWKRKKYAANEMLYILHAALSPLIPLEPNSTTRTPATNTSYEHHQRTKICHIPTSWHVEMFGSGIAMWHFFCRIVVSLSVGGVRSRCPCSGVWLLACPGLLPGFQQKKVVDHVSATRSVTCSQNVWQTSWVTWVSQA